MNSLFRLNAHEDAYDVVICGGGVAALLLARQLKLNFDAISVLIVEKAPFPRPIATCKVGESTVELSSQYMSHNLQLANYLKENHLVKFGLRFYWTDTAKSAEIGLSRYPQHDSYQIDRGMFENDLYAMNKEAGVHFAEESKVTNVDLQDNQLHQITYTNGQHPEGKTVKAKWVIDASGRHRLIQKKLGLVKEVGAKFSSLWFRVKGRVVLDKRVPQTNTEWHQRVQPAERWHSTVHLMGQGYFIWIIPLGSGNTSVGISASGDYHPFKDFHTYKKALKWLEKHQPELASVLQEHEVLDTMATRNYSYSSTKVFSQDRWACVGEAAVFPDPFYSPGYNLIAFANSMVTQMIKADKEETLTPELVKNYSDFVILQSEWVMHNVQSSYPYFGDPFVVSLSVIWDLVVDWTVGNPQMFHQIFLNQELSNQVRGITKAVSFIHYRMKKLFTDLAARPAHRFSFDFIDYYATPFLKELRDLTLNNKENPDVVGNHTYAMDLLENAALAFFLMAVADVHPHKLDELLASPSLDPNGIDLDPEKWQENGLFNGPGAKQNFKKPFEQLRNLYKGQEAAPQPANEQAVSISLDF